MVRRLPAPGKLVLHGTDERMHLQMRGSANIRRHVWRVCAWHLHEIENLDEDQTKAPRLELVH